MKRRLKNNFLSGLVLALAGLCLGAATLDAATFTASLDRDTIALGESATLSLTFEGGSPKDVPTPDVPGLQIVNAGNSQNFSILNGQMSSTVTVTYSITPRKNGEFVIPSLVADVGGQRLSSPPLRLKVLPPNSPPAAAINSGSEVAFMKLTLSKNKVYVGEVITAQLELYFRQDVQNYRNFQVTALPADGFTAGKLLEGQHRRVQMGNTVYTVVPALFTLTARKTGTVSVGPVTATVVVVLPSSNPHRDPFFGQFRDPFGMFGGGEQKQVSLATEQLNVELLPLPTGNAPANFNGAIGNYTMTVTAGPTNVAVGDPITMRIQISGRGALDALALPDQSVWRDFKTYPPTVHIEPSGQLGIEGAKMFEQIVTPQSTDVHELPAFSFSYFDPEAGTYRTLTNSALPLAVHSGGTTPAPMIAATKTPNTQPPPPQQDILPIKEQFGALTQTGPPLLTRPVFLAMQSLPVLAWLAAFVWRKRTDSLANNPRLRRQRRVAGLVQSGLNDLHRLAAENNSDEFFATLFRLLQEQLGERLDCSASSITEAVIDERLVLLGAPETTLAGLRELFQLCNQARYAPMRTSGELAAVIPQFENAVSELQDVKA